MPQLAYKPFKARTIRITNLDDCCTPPPVNEDPDGCDLAVFDSFTTVSLEANVEEGETAFERKANGDVCINERDPNLLQDLTVSLTLCQIMPEAISLLTGWPVTRDEDGVAVGFDIMEGIAEGENSIEFWTGVAGVDCGAGARYGYNALPCTYGWQLAETIEWGGIDVISSISLTGTTRGSHGWGSGPYAVQNSAGVAGPLLDPMQTGAHARLMVTDVPPPDLTDGCVPADAANGYLFPPTSL